MEKTKVISRLGAGGRAAPWTIPAVALVGLLGFPALVQAEDSDAAQAPVDSGDAASAKASPAAEPFLLKLNEGDSAFLARDYDGAAKHYADAIVAKPREAIAHFRLGEALRAQGKFDEAIEALGNAARFANKLELKARAVFVMADTYERAERLPRAKDEWGVYLKVAEEHATKVASKYPSVSADDPVHAASAKERLKQIAAAIERYEAYAAVKERIERREKELDEQTRAAGGAKKKGR